MLVKLSLLLFCCALINAKSLVRKNPRHEIQEEIKLAKLPDAFRDLFRDVENNDVVELRGENIPREVDAEQQQQQQDEEESNEESNEENKGKKQIKLAELPDAVKDLFRDVENNDVVGLRRKNKPREVDAEEEEEQQQQQDEEESNEESNEENKETPENNNVEEKKEEDEEEEDDDDDVSPENTDKENTKDEKEEDKDKSNVEEKEEEDEEEEEEEEEEEGKNTPDGENKDQKKDDKDKSSVEEEEEEEEDEEEEEKNTPDGENKDQKDKSNVEEDEEDEEEEEEENNNPDGVNEDQKENKNDNVALSEKLNQSSDEETLKEDTSDVQLSDAFVGNEMKFLETSKFPKQSLDLPPQPKKIPTVPNLQSSNAFVENEIKIPDTFKFPKQIIDLPAQPKKISTASNLQSSNALVENKIEIPDTFKFPKQIIDLPAQPKKISTASNLQSSNALVENKIEIPDTFKFPKQIIDLPAQPKKISTADNILADKVINFFALESIIKNFLPSKDSLPKKINEKTKTNEESVMKEIERLEKNNNAIEDKIANKDPAQRLAIDIDLDSNPLGNVAAQAIPKNLAQIQATLQGAKDLWQKNNVNDLKNKVQQVVQDLWQKTNFKDLYAKFQQGNGLWQENIKGDTQQLIKEESKVGFGGQSNKQGKLMFEDATAYVNKAVQRAQSQLNEKGRIVYANNPPLTINLIPGTPITFKLKYVEGADTLNTYGQSKAIHYNKLYAFTQYKFTELKYHYDVIISPFNLYNIRKSITVILKDAPAKMNVAVEKDNKMNILGLEFVNPIIMVDCGSHRFINYGINYLINDVHPVIKQKLVEIVSRDSKLLLTDYMKDAQ